MGKKKKRSSDNELVFTTGTEGNSFFNHLKIGDSGEEESGSVDYTTRIRVSRDRKNRGGKTVTLIVGLELSEDEMTALCKKMKNKCGVGGAVKDDEIIIQGDQVKKVIDILIAEGFKDVKQTGG